jgi:hypothetical protein
LLLILQISNDFPRLSVPHLVLMQQPQTEVEVVCGVQSQLEVKIGWIVFAEDIQLTGNNLTGEAVLSIGHSGTC